jgi:peptide/nickel transport system substrate-binding protein
MLISGRKLGKNLALILQERAKKVGIKIDIVTKSSKLIRTEIANRNFDLYPSGINYGLYPEDLYQYWHSDNDYPGGSNKYGYNNPDADRLIEDIRQTKDTKELEILFREIQEVIYEDQPFVFLYAPTNNIVVSKNLDALITVKKPGIFLNAFTQAKSDIE